MESQPLLGFKKLDFEKVERVTDRIYYQVSLSYFVVVSGIPGITKA